MAFAGSWSCAVFLATSWRVAMRTAADSRHDALRTDVVTGKEVVSWSAVLRSTVAD